jgi:hypothetical protein
MKKPKFGIVVAVTQSPMAKAYKKAVGAKKPSPEDSDPLMLAPKKVRPMPIAPKGEKGKGLAKKERMPVAPKSGKPPKYKTRTDKKM